MLHEVIDHDAEGHADAVNDEVGEKGGEDHHPTPPPVRRYRYKGLWVGVGTNDLEVFQNH